MGEDKIEFQLEQVSRTLEKLTKRLDEMDKIYVRLERYLIFERIVSIFVLSALGAALGLVWTNAIV